MGIKGAHRQLKKWKLFSRELLFESVTENYSQVHLDFLGTFYGIICRRFAISKDWDTLSRVISKILPPSTKLVIVMDGKGSDQKSETHKARMLQRENTLQKMKQLLDQVSSLPSDVKVTAKSRKSFNKFCRGAFVLTEEDKQNITITLCNAGYNVVTAFGEADVYLAKETRKCCISSDSDILFHGKTKIWLVPIIRGNILWVKMVS
ncbi:hypothetical protein MP638_001498 [Amoeboaphelidium occidentale]|nr:hypothetical protein MP638_001498 [Amoeboaphelidium occidentale]